MRTAWAKARRQPAAPAAFIASVRSRPWLAGARPGNAQSSGGVPRRTVARDGRRAACPRSTAPPPHTAATHMCARRPRRPLPACSQDGHCAAWGAARRQAAAAGGGACSRFRPKPGQRAVCGNAQAPAAGPRVSQVGSLLGHSASVPRIALPLLTPVCIAPPCTAQRGGAQPGARRRHCGCGQLRGRGAHHPSPARPRRQRGRRGALACAAAAGQFAGWGCTLHVCSVERCRADDGGRAGSHAHAVRAVWLPRQPACG